jgi:hypothetical protein
MNTVNSKSIRALDPAEKAKIKIRSKKIKSVLWLRISIYPNLLLVAKNPKVTINRQQYPRTDKAIIL